MRKEGSNRPLRRSRYFVFGLDLLIFYGYIAGRRHMDWIRSMNILNLLFPAWIVAPAPTRDLGSALPRSTFSGRRCFNGFDVGSALWRSIVPGRRGFISGGRSAIPPTWERRLGVPYATREHFSRGSGYLSGS
jgi:hypothetical protein